MSTRKVREKSLKEDIKHILEELWDLAEEKTLYKVFTIECLETNNIQDVLQHSKTELKDLSCKDDDDYVLYLQKHDMGKVRMMVNYQSHLSTNNILPEDIETCRFTSITRKDCISFVRHPESIPLVSSRGDVTTAPPANSGLADNFKIAYFPAESFKKSIKRDASLLNTFKEGKYWDTWRRNTLATPRAQDICEVLNPNYSPETNDDVNLFR